MGSDVFCLTYFSNSHNINDSASSTQDSTLDVIAMKGVYPMKGYVALPSVMLRVDDLCRFYATESLLGTCAYVSVCVCFVKLGSAHGVFFPLAMNSHAQSMSPKSFVRCIIRCPFITRRPKSFVRPQLTLRVDNLCCFYA